MYVNFNLSIEYFNALNHRICRKEHGLGNCAN